MEMETLPLQEPVQQTHQQQLEQVHKAWIAETETETETETEIDTKPETDDFLSEPFEHPSSPIHKDVDESLTHENLFLLDNSLTLTDNGHDVTSTTASDADNGNADLNNTSYISFPSSGTHSRANSVVSSAIMSTSTSVTNNTTHSRRRRPRPWDNYNAKDSNSNANGGKVDGETTPLLASKQQSIHSVKTAKRSNAAYPKGRKAMNDNDGGGGGSVGSPHMFSGGQPVGQDNYGSINKNGTNGNSYGYSTPTHLHHHSQNHKPPPPPLSTSISIANLVTVLTVLQFILMALYNVFLHYQSHRLQVQPPYAFWFSDAGRIYNSGIGPNVPTLILFGAFHPILALKEWWRMGSGLFCCTSLVEFVLNIWWLRVLGGIEEDRNRSGRGSWVLGFVYVVSGVFGGLVCIIFSSTTDIMPTGLTDAGIIGCMTTIMVHDNHGGAKSLKGNGDHRRKKWSFGNIGLIHAAIFLEILCGFMLPYTSLHSIIAGVLMGICCGFFFLSSSNDDWDDVDSQTSSMASDLEEAFSPTMNTPPRYNYGFDDSPPPPPSSSSKGVDTPIMRRSILTSPDEEDEYDLVQSLNKSGGRGLKQRNVKSAQKASYSSTYPSNNDGNKGINLSRKKEDVCNEARMRFIGMLSGLVLVSFSVLYIGLILDLPSEQTFTDSLYGCKTVHGFYEYAGDTDDGERASNDDDKNAAVSAGDTICGEICIPFSIYDRVMESDGKGISSDGACSMDSYSCNYSSDAFDVGFIEIERDLYTKQCAQNQDAN